MGSRKESLEFGKSEAKLRKMTNIHDSLIAAASAARENAHAPYSNFRVGAAVRARSGRVFAGCNVENSTYGLTLGSRTRRDTSRRSLEGISGFDAVKLL